MNNKNKPDLASNIFKVLEFAFVGAVWVFAVYALVAYTLR